MADTEAKKILTGLWADTGDRTDPDDPALTPVLVRTAGWPASFSATDGDTPRRSPTNQRFRELDGAAADGMRWGLRPWDADIDYHQHARVSVDVREFRATVANGPASSNATDPTVVGNTVWAEVAGTLAVPAAPAAPSASTPRSGELDWFWGCPLDNGARVTAFEFQHRNAGTLAWSASQVVTVPRVVQTGLPNGQGVEAQVRATNSQGTGGWSPVGAATPRGTVPGGGSTLALRADPGDGLAVLDWFGARQRRCVD